VRLLARGTRRLPRPFLAIGLLSITTACASLSVPPITRGVPDAPCRRLDSPALPFEWRWPADHERAPDASAWCETVGPPLVLLKRTPPAARPATTIAIVSWNTHVGQSDLPALMAALDRGDLSGGTRPDDVVLLLQEVLRRGPEVPASVAQGAPVPPAIRPSRGRAADIQQWAETLDQNLVYLPAMRNGEEQEDRGNAIVTTLPVRSVTAIELPFARRRRTGLIAELTLPDRRGAALKVANVHFDTGLALGSGGPARLRLRTALALLGMLQPLAAPLVVGGDLNTSWGDDEPAVRTLQQSLSDADPHDRALTFRGPFGVTARLDHMFAQTNGMPMPVARAQSRFGSDHYPLVALFKITP
jgi:endonuclease/exonuclease/phosphatase family metal-dependent hydrolase